MRNWITEGSKYASKMMCVLVNQRIKTCISVQDLEYTESFLRTFFKIDFCTLQSVHRHSAIVFDSHKRWHVGGISSIFKVQSQLIVYGWQGVRWGWVRNE
jgi:hypothetical protein